MGRIRLLSILILLAALLFIGRLYFIQVVDHTVYAAKANRQYSQTASGVFDRGSIYFTTKDGEQIAAATLKSGVIVAVNPQILKQPSATYQTLAPIFASTTPLDYSTFMSKATAANSVYAVVADKADTSVGDAVDALNIPGVGVYAENWRFYPASTLAANTVGFMAYQGNDYAGRYGLERQYDATLSRNNQAFTNFFAQIFGNLKETEAEAAEGDVVTSIEPTVQSFLQNELQKIQDTYHSQLSGGIIINPTNGEIYAMAVNPSFDLNDTKSVTNVSLFSNPLVENVYEMGSIIKPLTVSAGIDLGMITASSTYYDPGCIIVDKKSLCNFDKKNRGTTDIQTALGQSLNVGMAHIVSVIGDDQFTKYMYGFGVGQKSGIDLPNEAADLVSNLNTPRDLEHMNASFGQGIALSPIATVRALSAVANGGVLITPHVATEIDYKDGLSKTFSYPITSRAIKASTSHEVTRMLVYDVDNTLQNGTVKFPNYSVAAKTGTAQIAENGTYSANDFLHSFFGYFPAYNPKFLIFLYTVKPQGVQYSSESLTDPFIETVRFLINYFEIPPDR